MTIAITCSICSATAKIPTSLFTERFAGRKTTIRCKRCFESIVVDDSSGSSLFEAATRVSGTDGSLGALEMEARDASEAAPPAEKPEQPMQALPLPEKARPRARFRGALAGVVMTLGVAFGVLGRAPHAKLAPVRELPAVAGTAVAVSVASTAFAVSTEATPLEAPKAAPVASSVGDVPIAHDERALGFALRWGVQQAEVCHRQGGRPAERIRIELTFENTGKVSLATLAGESVPGSAEERCILTYLRALKIPAFEGQSFRVTREIGLR